MSQKINIAIDGYSSCGKGTLARMLADELSYIFIDTGAMYRTVALAALRKGIPAHDEKRIVQMLPALEIRFTHAKKGQVPRTLLNGEDVEDSIRSMDVSNMVSPVSQIKQVREFLVAMQQQIGRDKGVVMDGRDIGTVVFPDAELKIFMTAAPEVRAGRRFEELKAKGLHVSFKEILENLNQRDHLDSTRQESPLKAATDALIIDNSFLSREQQFEIALKEAKKRIAAT